MKKQYSYFIKKGFLLFVLFNFLMSSVSLFFNSLSFLSDLRFLSFSFYYFSDIIMMILLLSLLLNISIILIVISIYFHLLLEYIVDELNQKQDKIPIESETEICEALKYNYYKTKKRVIKIVTGLSMSIFISVIIRLLDAISKY